MAFMMRAVIVAAVVAIGCGGEEPPAKDNRPALTDAYRVDVATVCDAEARAGASVGDPQLGQFLDTAVTSDGGRRLLKAIIELDGADKAKLLRAESARAGLDACAFADALARRASEATPK